MALPESHAHLASRARQSRVEPASGAYAAFSRSASDLVTPVAGVWRARARYLADRSRAGEHADPGQRVIAGLRQMASILRWRVALTAGAAAAVALLAVVSGAPAAPSSAAGAALSASS